MRTHTFTFVGTPIPLARPRFSGNHCWDSQKQSKLVIGIQMKNQWKSDELFEGPLSVTFDFYFPTPKRISETKKKALYGQPFAHLPDTDNCIKFYLDCANKLLFKDDALVTTIHAYKKYGPQAQVIMTLMELE